MIKLIGSLITGKRIPRAQQLSGDNKIRYTRYLCGSTNNLDRRNASEMVDLFVFNSESNGGSIFKKIGKWFKSLYYANRK